MTEVEEIMDKGHKIGIEEDIPLPDPHPEEILNPKDHIEVKTIILIGMTVDSPDLKVHPEPLPGG